MRACPFPLFPTLLLLAPWLLSARLLAADELRLRLDWDLSVEHAGTLLAYERGWYREKGIDLEIVSTGESALAAVVKGKADIGMVTAADLIRAVGQGKPVQAFAAHYQFSPLTIMTRKQAGFRSVRDLKGMRLGITEPADRDLYRVMLAWEGLTPDDVRYVEVTPPHTEGRLMEKLRNRSIDALIAWEFDQPVSFALRGFQVSQFPSYKHGFHFYGMVYFFKRGERKNVAAWKETLRAFLSATRKGWEEVYRSPEKAAEAIVDRWIPRERYVGGSRRLTVRQQTLELKLGRRFLSAGIPLEGYGTMTAYTWKKSLAIARRFGMIPRSSPLRPSDLYLKLPPSSSKGLE